MSWLRNLIRPAPPAREARRPLWNAVIAAGRSEHWYRTGGVADTLDGRFEAISLVLALVLHRIEDDPGAAVAGVELTELFVDDMDGQMRQIGFGDVVVGKQIGKIMSAVGGRLGAYRAADGSDAMLDALRRNLWRGEPASTDAEAHVLARVAALRAALGAMPVGELIAATQLPGTEP